MNNKIYSLKDALLLGISIAENEDLSPEDRNSELDAVESDYGDYLKDSLTIFKPGRYSLRAFSEEEIRFIESVKLLKPSAEQCQAYLRMFAECDNVAMLTALANVAVDMGYTVAGIDRRTNTEKASDFAEIIAKLKSGETDDALALLEQVTDVTNITVEEGKNES